MEAARCHLGTGEKTQRNKKTLQTASKRTSSTSLSSLEKRMAEEKKGLTEHRHGDAQSKIWEGGGARGRESGPGHSLGCQVPHPQSPCWKLASQQRIHLSLASLEGLKLRQKWNEKTQGKETTNTVNGHSDSSLSRLEANTVRTETRTPLIQAGAEPDPNPSGLPSAPPHGEDPLPDRHPQCPATVCPWTCHSRRRGPGVSGPTPAQDRRCQCRQHERVTKGSCGGQRPHAHAE